MGNLTTSESKPSDSLPPQRAGCSRSYPMKQQQVTEAVGFLQAWIRNPLRVAAVAPSGRALAALITSEISHEIGPVIELGPGTGAFTRALIARGVREEDLALIEFGSEFAAALHFRYPRAHTLWMDATRLRTVELFGGRPAGAVVSGLPFLSMPPRKVIAILTGAFRKMKPDGPFYQFTYGPRCPVSLRLLDHLGLEAERVGATLANLPPAAVYRIRRRQPNLFHSIRFSSRQHEPGE